MNLSQLSTSPVKRPSFGQHVWFDSWWIQLGAVHTQELKTEPDFGTGFAGGSWIPVLLPDLTYLIMSEGKSFKLLQGDLDWVSGKMPSLEGWSGTGTQGRGGFTLSEVFKNPLDVVLRDMIWWWTCQFWIKCWTWWSYRSFTTSRMLGFSSYDWELVRPRTYLTLGGQRNDWPCHEIVLYLQEVWGEAGTVSVWDSTAASQDCQGSRDSELYHYSGNLTPWAKVKSPHNST